MLTDLLSLIKMKGLTFIVIPSPYARANLAFSGLSMDSHHTQWMPCQSSQKLSDPLTVLHYEDTLNASVSIN